MGVGRTFDNKVFLGSGTDWFANLTDPDQQVITQDQRADAQVATSRKWQQGVPAKGAVEQGVTWMFGFGAIYQGAVADLIDSHAREESALAFVDPITKVFYYAPVTVLPTSEEFPMRDNFMYTPELRRTPGDIYCGNGADFNVTEIDFATTENNPSVAIEGPVTDHDNQNYVLVLTDAPSNGQILVRANATNLAGPGFYEIARPAGNAALTVAVAGSPDADIKGYLLIGPKPYG